MKQLWKHHIIEKFEADGEKPQIQIKLVRKCGKWNKNKSFLLVDLIQARVK